MNKKKLRLFLKIFSILIISQLVVVLAHLVLNHFDNSATSVTGVLLAIVSLPLKLVNSSLPFYSGEGYIITFMFWVFNVLIQAVALYALIRVYKRLKGTSYK
ncbi:MAG: hypothetical protein HKN40_10000 [Winogradskyella sp.]|uniref:hypothetical protein n=1 Tax=Winogradskyella sp. TaxID=1883156 RepID=UPI0017BCCEF7|nr:hypothetical protein [Winogradskyella sp.]